MNVFAIIWNRFIGSRQNFAWTYYLILRTSLRKNFHFSQKPRWTAAVKSPESVKFTAYVPAQPGLQKFFTLKIARKGILTIYMFFLQMQS